MSTVTLSKPHCAITSAEKPDGIASQAFTTALPSAHTFLTLFATLGSFPVFEPCRHCEPTGRTFARPVGSQRRMMHLCGCPLNADFAHADLARGAHYRCPGIVRQGYPVLGAIGAGFPLGIAGDQHGIDTRDRLGRPDEVDIARNFAI